MTDRLLDEYEEIDYIPDQWDDWEIYPWDCDFSVPWEYFDPEENDEDDD